MFANKRICANRPQNEAAQRSAASVTTQLCLGVLAGLLAGAAAPGCSMFGGGGSESAKVTETTPVAAPLPPPGMAPTAPGAMTPTGMAPTAPGALPPSPAADPSLTAVPYRPTSPMGGDYGAPPSYGAPPPGAPPSYGSTPDYGSPPGYATGPGSSLPPSSSGFTPTPPDAYGPPSSSGPAPAPGGSYTVQRGDTLYRIAAKVYAARSKTEEKAGAERIFQANRAAIGPDRNKLRVGQTLVIPPAAGPVSYAPAGRSSPRPAGAGY